MAMHHRNDLTVSLSTGAAAFSPSVGAHFLFQNVFVS